jgi:hypothetical protein
LSFVKWIRLKASSRVSFIELKKTQDEVLLIKREAATATAAKNPSQLNTTNFFFGRREKKTPKGWKKTNKHSNERGAETFLKHCSAFVEHSALPSLPQSDKKGIIA